MALLDQYGSPITKQALSQEQATPDLMGVRSLLSNRQTTGLDPYKLARILRQADEGDMTAMLEMAEEIEEKDTHYISVLGTRKRAVAQLDITIEPASDSAADKENAKIISDWMKRDSLEGELMDMLDAIGKGFSVVEIIWDTSKNVWLPKDLKWKDPRWFEFSKEDGETLRLRDGTGSVPLTPFKFIVHKHKAKSGLAVRGGVVRPCAWMWLFKNFSIKDWVVFAEAYGQPIRIGKYNSAATAEDRKILMRAVANIGSDAAAIIPESMKIEFIEAAGKTSTAEVFEKLCNFCDQQISKAILGQTTTTDAISGGHAVSKEHNEVRQDIEKADAKQLAATLNDQLVKAIIILNKGEQAAYPRLVIGRSEQVDPKVFSEVAERAQKMGIEISRSKTREILGLPAPVDEDDILELPAAPTVQNADDPEDLKKTTAAARQTGEGDAIDELVEMMAEDYEQVMTPMLSALQAAADTAGNYDEFKEALLKIAGKDVMSELGEKLARSSFMTRLAGNVEMELTDDEQ